MNTLTANFDDLTAVSTMEIIRSTGEKFHIFTPLVGDFDLGEATGSDSKWVLVDTHIVTIEEFNSGF